MHLLHLTVSIEAITTGVSVLPCDHTILRSLPVDSRTAIHDLAGPVAYERADEIAATGRFGGVLQLAYRPAGPAGSTVIVIGQDYCTLRAMATQTRHISSNALASLSHLRVWMQLGTACVMSKTHLILTTASIKMMGTSTCCNLSSSAIVTAPCRCSCIEELLPRSSDPASPLVSPVGLWLARPM